MGKQKYQFYLLENFSESAQIGLLKNALDFISAGEGYKFEKTRQDQELLLQAYFDKQIQKTEFR